METELQHSTNGHSGNFTPPDAKPVLADSSPDFELKFCEKCFQMTNHLDGKCQKCKANLR